jgi:hypothetical protein
MLFTIVMFFALIGGFAAMFGVVKFAENIISRQRLAPVTNGSARRNGVSAKSL